jgi:transcriptional regulator with XRE-family HTH domain
MSNGDKVARAKPSVGAALRDLRLEAGLSINALARLAGLDTTTLTRIEAEDRTEVRFSTVIKVANALGVTADEIAVRAGLIRRKAPAHGPPRHVANARDGLQRREVLLQRGIERIQDINKQLEE